MESTDQPACLPHQPRCGAARARSRRAAAPAHMAARTTAVQRIKRRHRGTRVSTSKKKDGLTAKQQAFIDAMVFDGLKLEEAAQAAGMTTRNAYYLTERPEIARLLQKREQVLRTSMRPRALHRAAAVSEQSTNLNAAVAALKLILGDGSEQQGPMVQVNVTPGYVIDCSAALARGPQTIDVTPEQGGT